MSDRDPDTAGMTLQDALRYMAERKVLPMPVADLVQLVEHTLQVDGIRYRKKTREWQYRVLGRDVEIIELQRVIADLVVEIVEGLPQAQREAYHTFRADATEPVTALHMAQRI